MEASNEKVNMQSPAEHEKDDIRIFPTDDDRLKSLGEIFSNESSRKILMLLFEKELTMMDISKNSGLSLNLITHHLKKMVDTEIVTITRVQKQPRPSLEILSCKGCHSCSTKRCCKSC